MTTSIGFELSIANTNGTKRVSGTAESTTPTPALIKLVEDTLGTILNATVKVVVEEPAAPAPAKRGKKQGTLPETR